MRARTHVCILLQLLLAASAAAVVYVDKSSPDGGDGTSWETAFNTLQPAIDAAFALGGDEVWVAMGDYDEVRVVEPGEVPNWPVEISGSLIMLEGVEMYGGFAGDETEREHRDWENNITIINGIRALDGQGACHVVFGANNSVLDGFTVTGARLTVNKSCLNVGGGMVNTNASPIVRNTRFVDNFVEGTGGGMANLNSSPLIEDCVFEDNVSTNGGAIFNSNAGPTISRCQFLENDALGLSNTNAQGGAISNYASTPLIVNCIFWKNNALSPGAISSRGGAVFSYTGSVVQITNSTFYGNVATDDLAPISVNFGGAVFSQDDSSTAILNSILWANEPDQVNGTVTVIYSDVQGGYPGAGNIDADPLFVNAEAGDLRLAQGSPAIDSGTAEGAPDVDIRLVPRPQGAGIDMGAYEMAFALDAAFTADVTSGAAPLTVQFTDQSTGVVLSWLWDFGDGTTSTEQNPAHTYTDPGTYTVSLTVTSPDGTDTETIAGYIVVTPVAAELEVSFDLAPNFGMRPLLVQFTDTTVSPEPILSWFWRFGDGSTSTQQNPAHIYRVPGLFSVSLTVTTATQTETFTDRYAVLVMNKNGRVPKPWLLRWLYGENWQDYLRSKSADR